MLVDIMGIGLFASLAFTIYYLRKVMKLLRGGKGWKFIMIGYILYIPRVILSFFMDGPWSPIEIARISLSFAIIFFIVFGVWDLMNDLRRVGVSFFSLAYARYLTAGVAVFIACASIRASSFFFHRLNDPSLWISTRILLLSSVLMLGLALHRIYIVLGPKTKEIKKLMRAVEMRWLQDNLHIIPLYTQLTNEIIAHLMPIEGGDEVVRRTLERCASRHEILKGCEIDENGLLKTAIIIKNVEKLSEKERFKKLFDSFSCLNSMLIDAYAAITSPEVAMEALKDAEEIIEHMRDVNLPVSNELIYKHRIFFGMPEGIAENGKSKTFLYILLKEALEPLIKRCRKETIEEISAIARAKGIEINDRGDVNLHKIFGKVHEIPPGESIECTKSILSAVMNDIYPLIKRDLGEQASRKFSDVFGDLFEHHCGAILKYGILEELPPDISIPKWCVLLKRGQCYLICEEKPDLSLKLFDMLVKYGFKGLLISRTHPSHIRTHVPKIWLTHLRGDGHISPTNITQLSIAIKDFAEQGAEGVIMIEGFEYLIDQNGFDVALRFLESIVDIITVSKCRLLMPFDKLTVSEREFHRIAREMNMLQIEDVEEMLREASH